MLVRVPSPCRVLVPPALLPERRGPAQRGASLSDARHCTVRAGCDGWLAAVHCTHENGGRSDRRHSGLGGRGRASSRRRRTAGGGRQAAAARHQQQLWRRWHAIGITDSRQCAPGACRGVRGRAGERTREAPVVAQLHWRACSSGTASAAIRRVRIVSRSRCCVGSAEPRRRQVFHLERAASCTHHRLIWLVACVRAFPPHIQSRSKRCRAPLPCCSCVAELGTETACWPLLPGLGTPVTSRPR